MAIIFALIFVLFFAPAPALADTIRVPNDYATISEAIDAALTDDLILVHPGTYLENIDYQGKNLKIRSVEGSASTVIDGGGAGSVVTFQNGEGPTTSLSGFTVTNGTGTTDFLARGIFGGGIFCKGASPLLRDLVITGNSAGKGAGLYGTDAVLNLVDVIIDSNTAQDAGGGAYFRGASGFMTGCEITGNEAIFADGGGLYCVNGSLGISDCYIADNECGFWGGGIFSLSSQSTFLNNTIVASNTANATGGGIAVFIGENVDLLNVTLYGNRAVLGQGGALFANQTDHVGIQNSILWNDSAPEGKEIAVDMSDIEIDFCDLEGGIASVLVNAGTLTYGADNIDIDPLLKADYRLNGASPCIDKGNNDVFFMPEFDIDGDPRVVLKRYPLHRLHFPYTEPRVDMGADEFYQLFLIKPGKSIF